jgi:hypothetical protein
MPSAARNLANLLGGSATIPQEKLGSDISTIEQVATTAQLSDTGNSVGDQRVVGNNLFIWNGSGWFRIALINETPTWDSGGQPLSEYNLDGDSPQTATTITLAATDPDGLPINYSYVTGGSMDSIATVSQDSSVFTITPKTEAQAPDGGTGSITFRATDGVNILPQVSSFTLQFTDYTLKDNSAIYYDFSTNITSGTTVTNDGQINDADGYSSDGTLVGTTPPAYSTDLGGSLRFTKTSGQYLSAGSYDLNGKTNFSMVGCLAPLATTTYNTLVSNYQSTGFSLSGSGTVSGRMDNGDYDGSLVRYKGTSGFTTTVSNDGTPRVVGMTMTTNTLTSYLNGEACSNPLSIAGSIICNSGLSLGSVYLGSIHSGLIMDGYILYFAFYPSTALTTTQHNDMYLSLKSSFGF